MPGWMNIGGIEYGDEVMFGDGIPCFHPGCRWHVTHPCEMCGRRSCKGVATVKTGFLMVRNEKEEKE